MKKSFVALLILVALATGCSAAAEVLAINGVTLLKQDDSEPVVSIIIRDGVLDQVTEDRVTLPAEERVYDGTGRFLLGTLEVGAPPSFIVLGKDPREDFEVLLDTRRYAVFAIKSGEVLENSLLRDWSATSQEPRTWLAYTPPPVSLPTGYTNSRQWNRFETTPISGLFTSALIVDRQFWLSQDRASENQVGDLKEFEGGEIRAFRFGLVGTLNFPRPWVYTLFAATNAYDKGFDTKTTDDLTFVDWRLDIPVAERITLSLGKQKEPISLGRLMVGMAHPGMDERPAVLDALLPSRNVGAVLSGRPANERVTWAVGVFNNWLDQAGSISDNATQYVGRVTWLPYLSQDENGLVHLGAGYRYSDAKEGLSSETEPEFNQSPAFVGLAASGVDKTHTYGLEGIIRQGPWMLMGEYLWTDVAASGLGHPRIDGYYVTASWLASGEVRQYSKRNGVIGFPSVARPTSSGGSGAWEIVARYSHLDGNDRGLQGGEMSILSLGANWWLTQTFGVGASLRQITLDRDDLNGTSYGLMTRVVLALE